MAKIGRNDPCPCGSGKKYKQCCLNKVADRKRSIGLERDALHSAVDWLMDHYEEAVMDAIIENFFISYPNPDLADIMEDLPDERRTLLSLSLDHWILGDCEISVDEEPIRASSLLPGSEALGLDEAGERALQRLVNSRLSLYEVLEIRKNVGLVLRDLTQEDAEPIFVTEEADMPVLSPWQIYGLRVTRDGGKRRFFSGDMCLFPREIGLALQSDILTALDEREESDEPLSQAERDAIVSRSVSAVWIGLLAGFGLNQYADEDASLADDDEELLVTDHYQVTDWEALEELFEKQDDLRRSEFDGSWERMRWTRGDREDADPNMTAFERAMGGGGGEPALTVVAWLQTLNDGLLESGAESIAEADATRAWLEALAGDRVSHVEREVTDLRKQMQEIRAKLRETDFSFRRKNNSDAEFDTPAWDRIMADVYAAWPERANARLDGKTPLEACEDDTLKARLVEELKRLELQEVSLAKQNARPVIDMRFLWERLGLPRR
jgi:hypothetical protein